MKYASLVTSVFAILTMTLVAQNATTFDGTWSVAMSARNYQNPNGTMSLAYAWHFSMTVKNGILHGERGNRGMGDFYEINGTIAADGTATIRADGITGKGTEFTKGHRSPGTPFSYAVTAQFEDHTELCSHLRTFVGASMTTRRTKLRCYALDPNSFVM